VLRAAAAGLANSDVTLLLTTGTHRNPAELDLPEAPNIFVEAFVPYTDVLARTSVAITTGGAGTVMAALSAGVPQVVIPTEWDKPENARRVEDAGVGLTLHPRECTSARVRSCVETLLTNPGYRRRARATAEKLNAAGGAPLAARLLEEIALHPVSAARAVTG
jgi:MGT family glycosyltransferase